MSPTGRGGTKHQRLLAALLDPPASPEPDAAQLGRRDDSSPRIATWWEL